MKRIEIIHKEKNEECFEILKSIIIEDDVLKSYRIDKDTLLENLPEKIVNEFLDHISKYDGEGREIALRMIKEGRIILHCWED
mgnify:CR=1 FL=1